MQHDYWCRGDKKRDRGNQLGLGIIKFQIKFVS